MNNNITIHKTDIPCDFIIERKGRGFIEYIQFCFSHGWMFYTKEYPAGISLRIMPRKAEWTRFFKNPVNISELNLPIKEITLDDYDTFYAKLVRPRNCRHEFNVPNKMKALSKIFSLKPETLERNSVCVNFFNNRNGEYYVPYEDNKIDKIANFIINLNENVLRNIMNDYNGVRDFFQLGNSVSNFFNVENIKAFEFIDLHHKEMGYERTLDAYKDFLVYLKDNKDYELERDYASSERIIGHLRYLSNKSVKYIVKNYQEYLNDYYSRCSWNISFENGIGMLQINAPYNSDLKNLYLITYLAKDKTLEDIKAIYPGNVVDIRELNK